MVDILFYVTVSILLLIAPIFLRVEGTFSRDRKMLYVRVRLYFIKILTLRLYFHEDGVIFSLNGKKGKPILPKKREKKKKRTIRPYFEMIRFKEIAVRAYASGEPTSLAISLGTILMAVEAGMNYLKKKRILDRGEILLLPGYCTDQTTVNFSIIFFTSMAQILAALAHTKDGSDYGKRSDRKYDGENP